MDLLGGVSWLGSAFLKGDDFDSLEAIEWTQNHVELPIFCVMGYLTIIFQVPPMLVNRKPMNLKPVFAVWNLILSAFSFMGVYYTWPTLVGRLWTDGFRYTVCTDPLDWYIMGRPGLFVMLFIYSKIPELMDTVFLVLRKRPVIFLHWFHHCTVLLYCWHAYHMRIAPGLWFAGMNFGVHSVMYLYYFLQTVGWAKKFLKRIAPFITTIQIMQMVMGMVVTASGAYWHRTEGAKACYVDPANYKLGLAMYGIYCWLFVLLFKNLYLSPRSLRTPGGKKEREVCGVGMETGDAAGHFRCRTPRSNPSQLPTPNTKSVEPFPSLPGPAVTNGVKLD